MEEKKELFLSEASKAIENNKDIIVRIVDTGNKINICFSCVFNFVYDENDVIEIDTDNGTEIKLEWDNIIITNNIETDGDGYSFCFENKFNKCYFNF